jgi:hypothetical protein
MPKPTFCVWTWLNDDGEPVYVGWGKQVLNHPAKHVWASRDAYDSELNFWLRTCIHGEPDRSYGEGAAKFAKNDASHQCNFIRQTLKKKGYKLLSSRPIGTRSGGGSARGVLSPDLEIYNSVRQAAAAQGVNPSSVTRWCKDEDNDWNYLT